MVSDGESRVNAADAGGALFLDAVTSSANSFTRSALHTDTMSMRSTSRWLTFAPDPFRRHARVPRVGVSHRDVPGASRVAFLREEDRVDELARLRGEVRCAARESHEGVLLAHLCDLLGEGREQVEVLGRLGLARGDHVAEEAFALLQRARVYRPRFAP